MRWISLFVFAAALTFMSCENGYKEEGSRGMTETTGEAGDEEAMYEEEMDTSAEARGDEEMMENEEVIGTESDTLAEGTAEDTEEVFE